MFITLLLTNLVVGQDTSRSDKKIYTAYARGDLQLWNEVIIDIEESWNNSCDFKILEELVMAQYGYVAFCLKEDNKKEGGRVLHSANENLVILLTDSPEKPDYIALKAAFLGFEMGINPIKSLYLASRAKELTNKAYSLDNNSALCISVKANQQNFTPGIFGGSTEASIPYYKMLIRKFESGEENKASEWRYINSLVILAQAYEKLGMYQEACSTYEVIIAQDPGISWVKNGLYPNCLEQINKSNNISSF